MLLAALAFGGAFCGWVCPLGTVGEWLYKLRRLVFKKPIVIPEKLHKVLRFGRYVVLGLIILMSALTLTLWFRVWDPYANIFKLHDIELVGWIAIGVFALGSLLVERFFCLYLCPLSGVIHPVAKLSATGIVRNTDVCTSCGTCDTVCVMKIPVSTQTKINRGECIDCLKCLDECPVPGSLEMKIGW
jgi:polyferredoxin